ncbi:MAG: rod shape-determining protein RodA [Treponema sp.]|jgi:rod shape determining protein RodA|nr:rod shape-determining protein RodA [Treponema sp.]
MKFRDILGIDYFLLLPIIILLVLGILFIYSSGIDSAGVQVFKESLLDYEYVKQIIWASAGLLIALILSMINYRRFFNIALYVYLISLIPLVYTLLFGKIIYNAARWLRIGAFGLQMSEFVKISVILLLARFLADTDRNRAAFSRFFISCLIAFVPMGIVLLQPDLGTALVYIAILITMIYMAGVPMRYVAFMVSCMALTGVLLVLPLWQTYILRKALPFISALTSMKIVILISLFFFVIAAISIFGYIKFKKRYFFWLVYISAIIIFSLCVSYVARMVLKNYQLMRLIIFLDPNVDPLGAGWHINQSAIAIGAGGLTGTGYLQGTQSHYSFLPEQSTDFIFSIFSEESGFLGGFLVFALYLFICHRLLVTMKTVIDPFAKYVCAGLAGMYSFHFIVNVGMTMGIMPITGLPLLFMSYGGSAVISSMVGIGLVLSIYIRRFNR